MEDIVTSIITYRCNNRKPLIATTNLPDENITGKSVDYTGAGGVAVYKKTLSAPGTYAVAIVNLANAATTITLNWSDVGLATVTAIRDVWKHTDITPSGSGYTATSVPAQSILVK